MSSSKTLIRTGVSLMNRLMISPNILQGGATHQIPSKLGTFEITPKIFPPPVPSLSKFQTSLNLPQNHSETLDRLSSQGFLYPCGLPSLDFFLPNGDDSSASEPMLCIKRTYQPSTLRRKRNHGYLARKATTGGRRVIARRIAKGRARITA